MIVFGFSSWEDSLHIYACVASFSVDRAAKTRLGETAKTTTAVLLLAECRFLQGARIRTLSPGHEGPVSGMVYVKEDKVHRRLHRAKQRASSAVAVQIGSPPRRDTVPAQGFAVSA